MNYLSNVLNKHDSYTYQISLYQVNPQNIDLLEANIQNGNAVLIAKSGETSRYNIDDLEQIFAMGYGQVRNAFTSSFTMNISEQNGSTFLEKIVTSAAELGIENHLYATYLMQVSFLGRDENQQPTTISSPFYYPLVISGMQIRVSEMGSNYSVRFVETATDAFSYLESVLKTQISIEANTVGEFVEELERKIESSLDLQLQFDRNSLYPDEYTISFDDNTEDWKSWRIQQTDDSSIVGNNRINDKMQFIIPNGSSINDVIGIALQSTEEYKKIVLDNGDFARAEGPSEEVTSSLDEFKCFFKIVPNIKFGQFDPVKNNYVKKLEYKIKKYVVPDEIVESKEYANGILDAGIQNSRVRKLRDEGYLKKVYQYIYTGLNTEVLNFDVQLNHSYFLVSPVGGGQVGDTNTAQSRSNNDVTNVTERLSELKAETVALRRAARNTQRDIDQQRETVASTPINARNNTPTLPNNTPAPVAPDTSFRDNLRNTAELFRLEQQLQTTRQDLAAKDEELARLSQEFQTQDQAQPNNRNEQLVPGAFGNQASNENSSVNAPVRFASDVVDDSDIYGPESDKNGGVMQFGAVKTNLENSADLIEIELTIRGDPYWLGKPNSFYTSSRTDIKNLADYEQGGIMFFLNLQLPTDNPINGQRSPRSDYTISGTYRVINVITSYKSGQFIQYIKAVRDLATNTATAIDALTEGT